MYIAWCWSISLKPKKDDNVGEETELKDLTETGEKKSLAQILFPGQEPFWISVCDNQKISISLTIEQQFIHEIGELKG